MIAIEQAQLVQLADGWEQEATRRRQLSAHDPLADVLGYCASELRDRLQEIVSDTHFLTPEEYAAEHGVTPQTVRAWIRATQLEAVRTGTGWRIPRSASRRPRAHRRSAA